MIPYIQIERTEHIFEDNAKRALEDLIKESEEYNNRPINAYVEGSSLIVITAAQIHPAMLENLFDNFSATRDATLRMMGSQKRESKDGMDAPLTD